ncbi:MAG: LacI family transcriptional regulator [Lachnospiraceae bacterium]|nr:LacI family transcriptional regulator [Lachnospiraceae bacterium]
MDIREKVTLQDIADLAGISRNTVSKILNGRYKGSPKVRERVLGLVREKNYKGMGEHAGEEPEVKTILLLCREGVSAAGFFPYLVNEIQRDVEARGYILQYYGITPEELRERRIPDVIARHQVDGIVCMEIFDKDFIKKLIRYPAAIVFLEFCHDLWSVDGRYDVVMMDCAYPVGVLVKRMIEKGCRSIGFVGDYVHCRGFYERYQGYCAALAESGIPVDKNICITFADGGRYFNGQELWKRLKNMPCMPDGFVAANDGIAISLMQTLQERGIRIPEDVKIVSFDDIAEAEEVRPPLTTVHVDRKGLSRSAVDCLLQRMTDPERSRRVVYVETEIVYRGTFRS